MEKRVDIWKERNARSEAALKATYEFKNDKAPVIVVDCNYWSFGDLETAIPQDYYTNPESAFRYQLEKIDWHWARKREVAAQYARLLADVAGLSLQSEKPWAQSAHWINSVILGEEHQLSRDDMMQELAKAGIETRPLFHPMHTLPMYCKQASGQQFPVAERLAARGLNLPSSALLEEDEIDHVCDQLTRILSKDTLIQPD